MALSVLKRLPEKLTKLGIVSRYDFVCYRYSFGLVRKDGTQAKLADGLIQTVLC